MNELETRLYALLARPMRAEELKKYLPAYSKQQIRQALDQLTNEGKILKNKKNRYAHAEHYGCLTGVFQATERGYGFVTPETPDENGDVFIPPYATGKAWQGDRVLVHLTDSPRGHKREGEVMRILSLCTDEVTGTVMQRGKTVFVRPASKKYPDLIIPKNRTLDARSGDRVAVKVMFRGDGRLSAQGAITQIFGRNGTMEASIAAILHENGITVPFPDEVLRQADACGDTVDPAEAARRMDLREKLIFTIDGDDARDFDDAVSLEPMENGHMLLGVHIADVSHYVTPGSPLDDEAYRRGTSVYYPGHVVPMLPVALSNGICSLNPDVDRLAFSAFLEVDKDGRCHKSQFAKTVIRSKARMTYRKMNEIFDGNEERRAEYAFLTETADRMHALSQAMRRRRMERGALDLDLPEAEILTDESGEPVEVSFRARGDAEKMIEEFMLAANEAVAAYMTHRNNPTVYRVHESPDPEKLRVFAQFARPFGYRVDASKPNDTAQLQAVLDGAKDDPRQRALPTLLLRSLARARYDAECLGHYGLQAKEYLHFTSPIRRYPDLVAHRMLFKAISGQQYTKSDWVFCEEAASQSTTREFAADTAERDIDKLYLAAYMEQFIGQDFDGEVSGVTSFGLFVSLKNAVEGLIRVEDLPGDDYEFDDQKMMLIGRRSRVRYTMGTPMRVRLTAASRVTGLIDFIPAPERN
ncbi:ribonuclease R [Butyricicoccus pullicaecorum]|uniref:Ribonuclease R n=1 Tax=Butyricicoccus pullicaecorum TaxID=501571 RepID=A0A1Y4LEX5_9FIRM|nr:ribonuclease R [Butyricicoccus pullicaecorum]OUP52642.1 ribonuclease R [Butyricicoccus pullicaecorum]